MNAIKKYWDSVYLYVLLLVPGFCMCAGLFWTICKSIGLYPGLSWAKIILFDCSQIIYLTIALFFIRQNRNDSSYLPAHLVHIKGFIVFALFIQYNFILYLFASTHVWGCTFLFFAIIVFLFDSKLMLINILSYFISLLTAHIVKPEAFLPLDAVNLTEIIAFRLVIFLLTSLCIVIIVYFVEKFLLQAQESDEENRKLMEKQLDYFKDMELMDTELRKFRHDIKNHFICMESLLRNEKTEELQNYFEVLQQSFPFERKMIFSGNEIVDAILHHELPHNCLEEVNVSVYGSLPEITTVSAIDLCTLFSNLLSNAVKAANQCAGSLEPQITIHFSRGKKYFSIAISNSIPMQDPAADLKKKDRNHGYGMPKIQSVLNKYNGKATRQLEQQTLTITVYLPI